MDLDPFGVAILLIPEAVACIFAVIHWILACHSVETKAVVDVTTVIIGVVSAYLGLIFVAYTFIYGLGFAVLKSGKDGTNQFFESIIADFNIAIQRAFAWSILEGLIIVLSLIGVLTYAASFAANSLVPNLLGVIYGMVLIVSGKMMFITFGLLKFYKDFSPKFQKKP